jgi:hypothetical protein
MAIGITSVSTVAETALGTELTATTGDQGTQVWIYILNEGGTALAAGHVVMRNTTSTGVKGVISTAATLIPAIRILGVAQHAIASGSYGFVLRKGIGKVLIGTGAGGVADVTALTCIGAEAGSAEAFAAGTTAPACVFGLSVATIAAGATGNCWINCIG